MSGSKPTPPRTRAQLSTGNLVKDDPQVTSRLLSDLGDAVERIEAQLAPDTFTSTKDGLAPASGGGTSTFLRADGTWATPAGGGGGGALFTPTTQGEVPASGGGGVNYLRADGTWTAPPGAGVPTSRQVATTAPLTGGGALTTDLTLGVATFSSSAAGVVPASGGGTSTFLRADGTWTAGVAGPAGAAGVAGPPGVDGDPGEDGWAGPPGPAGVQGAQGFRGPPGEDGDQGEDGPRGQQGPQGIQGATGPQGPMGFAIDGDDGQDGFQGLPGPQGNPGPTGAAGAPGPAVFFVADDTSYDDALWVPPDARIDPAWNGALTSVVANQSIAAATATLITGTLFQPSACRAGQTYRWTIVGTAAAAGTAANTITLRYGTTGTVSDAAIATFTTSVGTAAASEFVIEVVYTVYTVDPTLGSGAVKCRINNSAAGGFINATVNVLASAVTAHNNSNAGGKYHVALTTGAAKTATIQQAYVEVLPGR